MIIRYKIMKEIYDYTHVYVYVYKYYKYMGE